MKSSFSGIKGIKVLKNEPLSKHTSFHIGGGARYFIKIYSIKALKKILMVIRQKRMRYFVIGAGTNLLVSDNGFPGVVLKLDGIFKRISKQEKYFYCGAGVLIDKFLNKAGSLGYGGIEFLAGIPGSIGGGIKGNAGAFGKSFDDITDRIKIIYDGNKMKELDNNEIGFGYRNSKLKNGIVIISAKFRLIKKRRKDIFEQIKRNQRYRWQQQPAGHSAGSFFKNPKFHSAGKLIEECGLKGLKIGDAEVSLKHGNFIINRGKAKATDVVRLARKIQKIVRKKRGIILKPEVKLLNL